MNEYPEHDKLAAVKEQSQAIGAFLDTGPWQLCWPVCQRCGADPRDNGTDGLRCCRDPNLELQPVPGSIQDILARYFKIDLEKIDQEKRAMLEELRQRGEAIRLDH